MPALWIPGAIHKPIPQTSTDPTIIPVGDVFHVAVSEGSSLRDFFSHSGGIESTGYIRRDGTIEQYRPLNVECDAQGDGNSWVTDGKRYGYNSWETQGMGDGEWTPQQLAAIKKIISFKHAEYGTPMRLTPAWNAPGFGYHRLFDRWNKNAHSCPGPDRVKQFNNIIVPWMTQAGSEDDMTPDQIGKAPITVKVGPKNVEKQVPLEDVLADLEGTQDRHGAQLSDIAAQLTRVEALLKKAIAGKA